MREVCSAPAVKLSNLPCKALRADIKPRQSYSFKATLVIMPALDSSWQKQILLLPM